MGGNGTGCFVENRKCFFEISGLRMYHPLIQESDTFHFWNSVSALSIIIVMKGECGAGISGFGELYLFGGKCNCIQQFGSIGRKVWFVTVLL